MFIRYFLVTFLNTLFGVSFFYLLSFFIESRFVVLNLTLFFGYIFNYNSYAFLFKKRSLLIFCKFLCIVFFISILTNLVYGIIGLYVKNNFFGFILVLPFYLIVNYICLTIFVFK